MICKYCGAEIPDSAAECPVCGKTLRKPVIVSRHTMPPAVPQKCVSREDIYNVINKTAGKKSSSELSRRLKAYGIVIAATAAILGIWVCLRLFVFHF